MRQYATAHDDVALELFSVGTRTPNDAGDDYIDGVAFILVEDGIQVPTRDGERLWPSAAEARLEAFLRARARLGEAVGKFVPIGRIAWHTEP
jgi:hypothetical protein